MYTRRTLIAACAAALLAIPTLAPATTGHADTSFHLLHFRPASAAPVLNTAPILAPDAAANVDASNESGPQSETTIAASPANPSVIVAGSNDIANLSHINAYSSSDRGRTWTRTAIPHVGACTNGEAGDPAVAANLSGEFFYSDINFACSNGTSEIGVAHSTDGGKTWTSVVAFRDNDGGVDKDQIAVDNNPNSPTKGRIYVSWDENFRNGQQHIELIWSDDNGLTWHAPVQVDVNGSGAEIFADPAVGPDGRVYDIWIDYGGVGLIKAAAASNTPAPGYVPSFTSNTTLGASGLAAGATIPAQPDRGITADPSLLVDASGRLYALWTQGQQGKAVTDVEFQTSTDSGQTWSSPLQVNDDNTPGQLNTGSSDFFPWGALDPTTGVYYVSFYSTRLDPTNRTTNVYVAVSTNAGASFSHNRRVTSAASNESTSNPQRDRGNNYGDYEGLTAQAGAVSPVWTDTRAITTSQEEVFTLSH